MVKLINEKFSITDGKQKLLSLCLLNCYKRITTQKSFDVKLLNKLDHYNYAFKWGNRSFITRT
jgi:hypothetical protein